MEGKFFQKERQGLPLNSAEDLLCRIVNQTTSQLNVGGHLSTTVILVLVIPNMAGSHQLNGSANSYKSRHPRHLARLLPHPPRSLLRVCSRRGAGLPRVWGGLRPVPLGDSELPRGSQEASGSPPSWQGRAGGRRCVLPSLVLTPARVISPPPAASLRCGLESKVGAEPTGQWPRGTPTPNYRPEWRVQAGYKGTTPALVLSTLQLALVSSSSRHRVAGGPSGRDPRG